MEPVKVRSRFELRSHTDKHTFESLWPARESGLYVNARNLVRTPTISLIVQLNDLKRRSERVTPRVIGCRHLIGGTC